MRRPGRRIGPRSNRTGRTWRTVPSVIVLPVPRPYKTRIAKEAINRSLPDAIAAFIDWLVNQSGWKFRARDIAVLFRRRTQAGSDLTREYARALEARLIPHLLAGSKSFHRREEVETLRAALTAIEWPDDELSVFATLKGSLFAIPDEVLLRYRHKHGHLHPFHKPEDAAFAVILEALALLGDLHRARNRQPFAATVNALLEATRAHAGFVLRPGGNQILANVARVAELARTYEMTGGISFRGFVEELAAQAEKEEAAEAPVLEEDSDGVRLMTVHGAKGLEFPVVILADLTANLAAREPDQFVDGARRLSATRLLRCAPRELAEHEPQESARERAEGVRVAYVAATRARDLLVVPAVGDEAFEGWLGPLNKAIYPSRANWRRGSRAEGCPEFGQATVLDRPMDYDRQEEFSVKPGLIVPEHGEHKVVWWDPSTLKLNVDGGLGLRQKELLAEDGGVSLAAYREWENDRAATLERGAAPQYRVLIASQTTDAPPGDAIPVAVEFAVAKAAPAGGVTGPWSTRSCATSNSMQRPNRSRYWSDLAARSIGAPAEERDCARVGGRSRPDTSAYAPRTSRVAVSSRISGDVEARRRPTAGRRNRSGVCRRRDLEYRRLQDRRSADSELRDSYVRQLQWYGYALTRITGMLRARLPAGRLVRRRNLRTPDTSSSLADRSRPRNDRRKA